MRKREGVNELKEVKICQVLHCAELITVLTPVWCQEPKASRLIYVLEENQPFTYKTLHQFVIDAPL